MPTLFLALRTGRLVNERDKIPCSLGAHILAEEININEYIIII